MSRIAVMHLTDSLAAGGTERVAVNLVNLLPRDRYQPYLCTTRAEGPMAELVASDVGRLRLARRWRFDAPAIGRLVAFIRAHDIQILHAHLTSLLMAFIAAHFPPHPAIVWHDHFGESLEDRSARVYRLLARRVSAVIAVNQPLAEWSRRRLGMPPDRVWYVPNFACEAWEEGELPSLPGEAGGRIVCVANLRPQKDHRTLLRAMALVVRQAPAAHLLLVGAAPDTAYLALLRNQIAEQALDRHVSLLGERRDVPAILRGCDIGVLSSASEGLPLALIEYGLAGLPAVATRVGQCAEVLLEGKVGVLVPPRTPDQLAEALLALLRSRRRREALAEQFQCRVQQVYSAGPIVQRTCQVYDAVLATKIRRG